MFGATKSSNGKQYSKSMVFDCVDLPEVIIKDQPYLPPPPHMTKTYYDCQPLGSSDQLARDCGHHYRPSTRQSLTFDPVPTYIERSPKRSPRCSRSPVRNHSRCSTPTAYMDRPTTPSLAGPRAKLCFATEMQQSDRNLDRYYIRVEIVYF